MKNFILIALAFFTFHFVIAQEVNTQSKDSIYDYKIVDVKPEFKGGAEGFYKFIAQNFKAPEQEGINGKILTTFIIEIDGSISNIKIVQDVGYGSGDEVIKVLSKCPKWNPARVNDAPVRVSFQLPISIKTEGKRKEQKKR